MSGMRMARAREEEIEAAMNLAGILDDVDGGTFPRSSKGEFEDDDPERFDEDDPEHLREFYERVTGCGMLFRVAFGYAVLTDPGNAMIDPDKSHIALHPRLIEGLHAAEAPLKFWLLRLLRKTGEIFREGWNL